jgi:hypothetical protein
VSLLLVVGRRSCWRQCCALIFNAVAVVSSFNALVVDINVENTLFSDKAVVRQGVSQSHGADWGIAKSSAD